MISTLDLTGYIIHIAEKNNVFLHQISQIRPVLDIL